MKRSMFSNSNFFIFNKAKELRKTPTVAEGILWQYLRTRPFGFKFRRQHPYSQYILDFYCHSLKLVIEVDGSIHYQEEVSRNDLIRQKRLEENKMVVLRFSNDEILLSFEIVVQKIETFLREKLNEK